MAPALTRVSLAEGPDAALTQIPRGSGVLQFVADGSVLVTGMAANLQRWAADRLGRGRPRKPGRRPPLDLGAVAVAVRYAETTSSFAQRLAYERLLAGVPLEQRKDLKAPGWLRLDLAERFPRVSVARASSEGGALYGPFRTAREAEAARDDVQRVFPIRPCDYEFEPAPDLELGQRCLFAQVGTCAAPCLQRTSESGYADLARRVAGALDAPRERPADLDWPDYVAARRGHRALVAEEGRRGLELYPLVEGRVLEDQARTLNAEDLETALAALFGGGVPEATEGPEDWPWVLAWLAPKRCKGFVVRAPRGVPAASLAESMRIRLSGS